MTIEPAQLDLTIYQGASFNQKFTLKNPNGTPVNLTGYSAIMEAKQNYYAASPYISLTNSNCGIIIYNTKGVLVLYMSALQTSALRIQKGMYELRIANGNMVYKIAQGNILLNMEVQMGCDVDLVFGNAQGIAGAGVAIGGSTGQVLAKNSSADYDTYWMNSPVDVFNSNLQTALNNLLAITVALS